MDTRKGEVTMKGKPVELVGPKLKPGDKAPDFTCVGAGLTVIKFADTAGKPRLFNVVPSLDTPVCNIQTKTFATELASLGDKVAVYHYYVGEPDYDTVRAEVMRILRGEVRPLSGEPGSLSGILKR